MSDVFSVRLPSQVATQVRGLARENGWTESQTIRALLEQQLGADPRQAALNQAVAGIYAQMRKHLTEISDELSEMIEVRMQTTWGDFASGEGFSTNIVDASEIEPAEEIEIDEVQETPVEGLDGRVRRRRGRRGGRKRK